MPPKLNIPVRICGTKTRSGCKTCKQRHLKCDERLPVCLRCEKAGRQCVNLPPQTKILQQTPVVDEEGRLIEMTTLRDHSSLKAPSPSSNISFYGLYDTEEVSVVKHFATRLGKELAGCFSDEVWCSILPRVAQHEPSIWYAIVAVSALDTNIKLSHVRQDTTSDGNMAIKQYSKAIQALNERLTSAENKHYRDVVLLSCLLFAVFECLSGHVKAALRHISSGMKLLMEWEADMLQNDQEATGIYLDYRSLQPIFFSLDSQAVQIGILDFRDYCSLPALNQQPQIPSSLMTDEEAHCLFSHIFNRMSRWAYWTEPTVIPGEGPDNNWMIEEKHRLRNQLEEWDLAFDIQRKLLDLRPINLLLLIQRLVVQAFFDQAVDGPSQMAWDNSLNLFREAVKYAEMLTGTSDQDHQTDKANLESHSKDPNWPTSVLIMTLDIVMPLFLIASKCRDSEVRRRALRMMKLSKRKEGIWDAAGCAIVAEKVIELEEREASEDGHIPESARIFMLDLELNEGDIWEVTYNKLVRDDDGGQHVETFKEKWKYRPS